MSDIVLLEKPRLIEVQALQPLVSASEMLRPYDPKNPPATKMFRFVRIEDGLKELDACDLTIAEWLDGDWPFMHNADTTLCPWGAIIKDCSFQTDTTECSDRNELRQAMLDEIWDNHPLTDATPVIIGNGQGGYFCTLFDALRYVYEENGRTIDIRVMTPGIQDARRTALRIRNFNSRETRGRHLLFLQPAA